MAPALRHAGALGSALLVLACGGREGPAGPGPIATSSAPGGARGGGPVPSPSTDSLPPLAAENLGPLRPWVSPPARLQRLTRNQYLYTVRDLLGVEPRDVDLGGQDAHGPSGFDEPGVLGPDELRMFQQAAESLSLQISPTSPGILPCSPASTGDEACAAEMVRTFGRRAFRRPLAEAEAVDLLALYRTGRRELGLDFEGAIRLLLSAILQSPRFLYRWEAHGNLDETTASMPLDGWARASRLSYFLWSSLPDAELMALAESGRLAMEAEVDKQARRLLADPRARRMTELFHRPWLQLGPVDVRGDDPAIHDALIKPRTFLPVAEQRQLFEAMARETSAFAREAMLGGAAPPTLATLLLGSSWMVESRTASLYEAAPVAGSEAERRHVPHRAGILTQASFLMQHAAGVESHPVRRGRVIFEQVLCGTVPEPPLDVPAPRRAGPGITTRDRYAEHGTNACAVGCHSVIDPLGFGLERFDGLGRFRTHERGKAVDTSGVARLPLAGEQTFTTTEELLGKLADSEDGRRCLVRQLARFALGRLEHDWDAPSVEVAYQRFAAAGFDIRELLVALSTTRSFLFHPPGRRGR